MAVRNEHIAILRNAVRMELEGRAFFIRAVRHMKYPQAKDMLRSLAKQELRHVRVLEEQLRLVESGGGWVSPSSVKDPGPDDEDVPVFGEKDAAKLRIDAKSGELEVLKLGIEIEKRSIDYYRKAAAEVDSAKAREVFNWLVGEEAGHLAILKAEHDMRSRSGFYYDTPEFSLEVM